MLGAKKSPQYVLLYMYIFNNRWHNQQTPPAAAKLIPFRPTRRDLDGKPSRLFPEVRPLPLDIRERCRLQEQRRRRHAAACQVLRFLHVADRLLVRL
jgi:hypothetical protein